jgi:hypothetical protein
MITGKQFMVRVRATSFLVCLFLCSGCSRSSGYFNFKGVRLDMPSTELKSALEKLKPRDPKASSRQWANEFEEGTDTSLLQEDLHIRTLSQKVATGGDAVVEICGSLSEWAKTNATDFEQLMTRSYGKPTGKLANGNTVFFWWGEGRFKADKLDVDYSGRGKLIMAKCIASSCNVLLRNHIVRKSGDFVILRAYGRMERYTSTDQEAGNGWVHVTELAGVPLCLN